VGPDSEDDIIITPRPKTPPLPGIGVKKVFENYDVDNLSIGDSDRESEASLVPIQKISKAKAKAAAKAGLEEKWQCKAQTRPICCFTYHTNFIGIILLIPQLSGASDRRKTLAKAATYEEAIGIIYETIGCDRHVKVYSNFCRLFTQSEGLVDDRLTRCFRSVL
jgi:hypothetical protein